MTGDDDKLWNLELIGVAKEAQGGQGPLLIGEYKKYGIRLSQYT